MKLVYQYSTLGPNMDDGDMRCLMYDAATGGGGEQFLELALAYHDTWTELKKVRAELKAVREE